MSHSTEAIHNIWRRFAGFMASDSAAAGTKGEALRFMGDPADEDELSGWVVRMRKGKEAIRATVAAGMGEGDGGEPLLLIRRIDISPSSVHTAGDASSFCAYLETAWWSAVEDERVKTAPTEDEVEESEAMDAMEEEMGFAHPPDGHGILTPHVDDLERHVLSFPQQGHDLVLWISAKDLNLIDTVVSIAIGDLQQFAGGRHYTRSGRGSHASWYYSYRPNPWNADYTEGTHDE